MTINKRNFEILLISLAIAMICIAIARATSEYTSKLAMEFLFNKKIGVEYLMVVILNSILAHAGILIHLLVASFLYFKIPGKEARYTWVSVGLLFGLTGLLFFFIFDLHKSRIEENYNLRWLGHILWIAISIKVAVFIYELSFFLTLTEFSKIIMVEVSEISSISRAARFINNLAIAIWALTISDLSRINRWISSLFALAFGIFCPIFLMLYSGSSLKCISGKRTE